MNNIIEKASKVQEIKNEIDQIEDALLTMEELHNASEAVLGEGFNDYVVLKCMNDYGEGYEVDIPDFYIGVMQDYAEEELERLAGRKDSLMQELKELLGE